MTSATASKLDTIRFRKVHTLMTGGATEGERSAARARATAMATKAGLSLKEAVSKLDAPSKPKAKSFFEAMDDAMEEAHPGHKAEQAAYEAERERKRAALRAEAIAEFGSEDAVWQESDQERLLREALAPLADWKTYTNSPKTFINGYAGWTAGTPPLALRKVMASAYPFPSDIAGVWEERNRWERLQDIRCAFARDADMPIWVRARLAALEYMLDTMPAPTFDGIEVRLEWLEAINERGFSRDYENDARLIDTLRFDFATLTKRFGQSEEDVEPASVRRTNAEKRMAVVRMLDAHPGLSDREIARRVGVSPQTVNTWRRKR